jgi:hypothetical protein
MAQLENNGANSWAGSQRGALFQGMNQAIGATIISGAIAERGRLLPCIVAWTTLVYNPVARLVLNSNGWLIATDQNRASRKGSTVYHLIITDIPIAQGTLEHIDNAAEVWSLTGNTYVFVVLALKASPEIQSEATALSRVKFSKQ